MSATLIQRYLDADKDEQLLKKVTVALVTGALGNIGEAVGTVGATKRTTYAAQVLANPKGMAQIAIFAVVSDGTDNTASDANIQTRVNNLWNGLSGVRSGE